MGVRPQIRLLGEQPSWMGEDEEGKSEIGKEAVTQRGWLRMRLIDADILEPHEQLESMGNGKYEFVEVVYKDDIDDVPTIDAIPVVRCGECKYWKEGKCWNMKGLNKTDGIVNADDFCSYGEREDGEA